MIYYVRLILSLHADIHISVITEIFGKSRASKQDCLRLLIIAKWEFMPFYDSFIFNVGYLLIAGKCTTLLPRRFDPVILGNWILSRSNLVVPKHNLSQFFSVFQSCIYILGKTGFVSRNFINSDVFVLSWRNHENSFWMGRVDWLIVNLTIYAKKTIFSSACSHNLKTYPFCSVEISRVQ